VKAGLRTLIISAVDIAVASGARLFKACLTIQLCPRRLLRWRNTDGDGRKGGYRAQGQKLSKSETEAVVAAFSRPEIAELPIKAACATLMDLGQYLASPSTCSRVLAAMDMTRKKAPRKTGKANRPELRATGPGQVWCWDITWLDAPLKGTYFYLYMAIDMFSRKVVAWEVYAKEDGTLARDLFAEAMKAEGISPGTLLVHADNGRPMRSQKLRALFDVLQVTASYGRPHTSNDNAFAESLFATFKGRISFPEYFASVQSARDFCMEFFTWYNGFHLHSNLDYVTPQIVHDGLHPEIFANRNFLLEMNRAEHPSRHGGREKVFGIPSEVCLKHRTSMTAVV
jgi:transposase InsO family protein